MLLAVFCCGSKVFSTSRFCWTLFGIFSYNILRPPGRIGGLSKLPSLSGVANYHTDEKMLGIIIFTIGINILIRRILSIYKVLSDIGK
jgi:hypothetical protein